MKKFLLQISLFGLILNGMLFSQWSTDPSNTLIVGYGLDPHICSDSTGGCYITYDYDNIYYPRKLGLEKLNRYGYKPWGTLKQILGEFPQQYMAEITEDGEGGVIVSYIDRYENLPTWTERVRVQKIDSSANFLWGQTGVRVTTEEINQGLQQLISDGNGGCAVTWKTINSVFYINRINADGERLWGDSGKVLGISHYSGVEPRVIRAADGCFYGETGEYIYRIRPNGEIVRRDSVTLGYIVPDSEGGIVLSGRVWTGMIPKLVAQRKDSLGNNLWQEPYVEVADSLYINSSLSIKYNDGNYYYGWAGNKNGIAKVAQFQVLRSDGSKLFPEGSIQIGDPPLNATIVQPLERNRTAFIYYSSDIQPDTLLVQAYDTLGNEQWNENGLVISHPPIEYQSYTTDGNGGFIIGGVKDNFTVVAQQVNKYGQLGEVIIPVELISFNAEVINKTIKLRWITATEENNRGFEIQRLKVEDQRFDWEKIGFVEGNGTATEPKSYSFTDADVAEEIYNYRLKQIDYDGTFKYSYKIKVTVNYIPKEYILSQNYPNPFNSTTIIKYQIPEEGRVRVNLYNILGEKIKTLYEGDRIKGEYTLVVSSDGLSSGAYFYSLETNSSRTVKKLTILK